MIERGLIALFDWGESIRPTWVGFVVISTALAAAAMLALITVLTAMVLLAGVVMGSFNLNSLSSFLTGAALAALAGCWYHALFNQTGDE